MQAIWTRITQQSRSLLFLAIYSCSVLYSGNACADMSVHTYQKNIRDSSKIGMTQFYLEAVGTGITWTNSVMKAKGGKSLFCAPGKFKLTGSLASKLINNALQNASRYGIRSDDSISYVLLIALANTYRC